jgi:hypothetical protein
MGDDRGNDEPAGRVVAPVAPAASAGTAATTPAPTREWKWPLAVAILHALLFAPIAIAALFRPAALFPNLWLWHAARVPETFRTPLEPIQPHFGWPGVARLIDLVLPTSDPRIAGAIVSILASSFFGVVLYLLFRRTDDGVALLAPLPAAAMSVLIALLENPAAIQGWEAVADADRAFLPLYYSFVPTTLASMGFNVLVTWMTAQLVTGRLGRTGRRWLPVLVVATAIAKPNLVPMLAGVALIAAVVAPRLTDARDRGPERTPRGVLIDVLRLVTLPAAAVTVLQFAILAWFSPPVLLGGVTLRPFYEMRLIGGFGWQFWLLLVLPLVALVLLRGRLVADVSVSMCLGSLAIGIAASLLFARAGDTVYQGEVGGDILQLASASAAVLIVFLVRRLFVLRARGELSTTVAVVCVVLLVPYLVAGLDTYRCHSGLAACYPESLAPGWPQLGIDEPFPDISRDAE